ncbi:MAG: PAS domain-containing protein [Actinobacteria bacterium]|nr:PAS domain-containing protein [Actinomycetota bacterium]
MTGRRPDARWSLAAAVAGYVVLALVALTTLLYTGLPADRRAVLHGVIAGQAAVLAIGGALALAGLVALVAHLSGRYISAVRRLAADTRLVVDANPDHTVEPSGPADIAGLASAVAELARRRRTAERAVDEQIAAARATVEEERNRLAALMAELAAAVLVCNDEGRILLYNAAAKSVLGDDAVVGLGRSVFGIVDRDLLTHAMERLHDRAGDGGGFPHVSTTLRGDQLLQVQVAPARGPGDTVTGYVLLLEDMTDRVGRSARREELVRDVTEGTRASLGSIQAAIENVLGYPDMDAVDRQEFLWIVREECARLGQRVQEWVGESDGGFGADWPSTDISIDDLLAVVARTLERDVGLAVSRRDVAEPLWVKVDSHSVTRALAQLTDRLREDAGVAMLVLSARRVGGHAQIELTWSGRAPASSQSWLDEPLVGGSPSARDVVARHGGEIWCESVTGAGAPARAVGGRLRLLFPVAVPVGAPAGGSGARTRVDVASRPEFYDFGLFERHSGGQTDDDSWSDRDLAELSYTVFDTETTGLDPQHGDRIISIGAVRIVNGRMLHGDTYERLVDPQRAVPSSSTAFHGLTTAMVRGQPTIDTVLPTFDRFAADTVLVGHNVGFDMQFLGVERARVGMPAARPVVLDTLLLDAAVHPDHDEHSLEAIAGRLGVDILGRHTALGDALVTGEIFIRLVALLRARGVRTLAEAVAASRATLQARLDTSFYGS